MIVSLPATEAAFQQLIAALDAEVKELNAIGSKVAIHGVTQNAPRIMKLARERAIFRDHIVFLHNQWKQDEPAGIAYLQVQLPEPLEPVSSKKPVLSRSVKGLSLAEAAKKLMVKPAKVKTWLETGTLKGYRRVSGTWKITQSDLADFYRNHRDLI